MYKVLEIILHFDTFLGNIITQYGFFTYFLLFAIIFLETGLVLAPFLPGDSLLFAVGAFAAQGSLNIFIALIVLILAAVLGDTLNYWMGKYMGTAFFSHNRFFKASYLKRTESFYSRYGAKAIVLARFVPIVRTFAPFVAGIGSMNYGRFIFFNIIGAVVWVGLLTCGGYFFGNIPLVRENFGIVVIVIIALSFIPLVIELVKHRISK